MQSGTISEIGQSKSGKPKVKISGTWYSIGTTHGLQPGSAIEFEAHEFQYNGKQFWGIDKFGLSANAPPREFTNPAPQGTWKPNTTTPLNAAPSAPEPANVAPRPAPSPQRELSEPELRFISNCVGSAIAAKTIEDPIDLIAWAKGAQAALKSLTDVPF